MRFGRIGRFYRFGSRREVRNIGEAARGQRQRLQVLPGDDALVNLAGNVDWLGGDGGSVGFDVHRLPNSAGTHRHHHVADRANFNLHVGRCIGKSSSRYRHVPCSGGEPIDAKLAAVIAHCGARLRSRSQMNGDGCIGDTGSGGILHNAAQCSGRVLRLQCGCTQHGSQSASSCQSHHGRKPKIIAALDGSDPLRLSASRTVLQENFHHILLTSDKGSLDYDRRAVAHESHCSARHPLQSIPATS